MIPLSDLQKIGIGLTCFGVSFLILGIILFFDKGLLAIGNVLFISGIILVIGLSRTYFFFFQRHKIKATSAFLGGLLIVLIGWPLVGIIIEMYGFILLFGGFLPSVLGVLRTVPGFSTVLNMPGISKLPLPRKTKTLTSPPTTGSKGG